MRKRKLSNEQLIAAVERVSKETTLKEIESLILQLCTRIKNSDPLPPSAFQAGYRGWEHVLFEIFRNLRRKENLSIESIKTRRNLPSDILVSSSPENNSITKILEITQALLPMVIQKFTPGKPDYSGTKEYKEYWDYWFEVPGSPGQYASVGISKKDASLYWCAPKPASNKLQFFLNAGYYEDGKELYKDFLLQSDFCNLSTSQQEHWFNNFISAQLMEYDELEMENY